MDDWLPLLILSGAHLYRLDGSLYYWRSVGWAERSLSGAMKTLGSKTGYLVAPTGQESAPPKAGGIGIATLAILELAIQVIPFQSPKHL